MPYLVHHCLRLRPFVFDICTLPRVKCSHNSIDDLLLFSGLGEVRATLFIETSENLFQSINGIVLNVMANLLKTLQWHVTAVKNGMKVGKLTSKSSHTSELAIDTILGKETQKRCKRT